MNIDARARGFALTEPLRNHTHRCLQVALAHAGRRVRRVTVRLFDVNGPRRGADKCCRITAGVDGVGSIVAEHTEADLYVAVRRAADRLRRALSRRIRRSGASRRPALAAPTA